VKSGTFNVHELIRESKQDQQLTNFTLHPVRFLSMGNRLFVLGMTVVYTMTKGTAPKKVIVNIITQDKENSKLFL
jgi:hypothetical protein